MTLDSPFFKQLYASAGTDLLYVVYGYIIGLQAVMLPQLRAPDSPLKLDLHQESWIASVSLIVIFPIQLISGAVAYKIGRKKVLLFSVIPAAITCILIFTSTDYRSLIITFLFFGTMMGGISVGTLLIGEICSPKYRSAILNIRLISSVLGVLIAHILGNFFNYKTMCLLPLVPCFLSLFTIATSPESPLWLATKGRFEDSRKAFNWLRGDNEQKEINRLIETQRTKFFNDELNVEYHASNILKFVFDKAFLKAVGISFACIIFLDVCGKHVFTMFPVDAITSILGDAKYAYFCAAIFDICDISMITLSSVILNKLPLRTVVLGLGTTAMIVLLLFCFFTYMFHCVWVGSSYRWVSFVLMLIYFSLLNIGVIPALFVISCEVCPITHRELGLAVNSCFFILLMFVATKFTPHLMQYYDIYGLYLINATFMIASLTYLYFFLPETKKKSLQEIDEDLQGNKGEVIELFNKKDAAEKMII